MSSKLSINLDDGSTSETNLFLETKYLLLKSVNPTEPESVKIQLILLSALYAIITFLVILTFLGRLRRRTFSLCRTKTTPYGDFLVFDGPLVAGSLIAVFSCVMQVLIWHRYLMHFELRSQRNSVLLEGLVWVPMWLACWCRIQGIVVDYMVESFRSSTVSTPRRISPKSLNYSLVIAPLVFLIPITIIFIVASTQANITFTRVEELVDQLANSAIAFNGTLDLQTIKYFTEQEESLALSFSRWNSLSKIGFRLWLLAALSLLLLLVPFTFFYLHFIYSQMRTLQRRSLTIYDSRPIPKDLGHNLFSCSIEPINKLAHHLSCLQFSNSTESRKTEALIFSKHSRSWSDTTFDSVEWDLDGVDSTKTIAKRDFFSAESMSMSHYDAIQMTQALRSAFWGLSLQLAIVSLMMLCFAFLGASVAILQLVGKGGVKTSRITYFRLYGSTPF